MAQVAINAIIARQFISEKSGNATVEMIDLDTMRTFKVTFQGGQLAQSDVLARVPRRLVLDGFEFRETQESGLDGKIVRGGYNTCTNIVLDPNGNGKK